MVQAEKTVYTAVPFLHCGVALCGVVVWWCGSLGQGCVGGYQRRPGPSGHKNATENLLKGGAWPCRLLPGSLDHAFIQV